jgi:hypothetical protein
MSMLVSGKTHVDPNNVPLASLVAQEEHVDVNFIRNNNFNNNAYRNNFGSNNYRPYPSTNGNGYGNSSNNSRSAPCDLEVMLKDFISKQTTFNKSIEEKFGKIDVLASKVDSLALDVELLKLKVMPHDDKESKTLNAIQVRIDDNVEVSNASKPPTMIGVVNVPAPFAKLPKTTETFSNKSAEIFRSMGDNGPTTFDNNDFDLDGCNISEVIMFL